MSTAGDRVSAMRDHVYALAAAHGVTVEHRRAGGRAWRRSRRISIAPVRSGITYLGALHELGHVVSDGQRGGRRMEREADAWRWALDNAAVELTPATYRNAYRCLCSYLHYAVRARLRGVTRGAIAVPEPDSDAWDVLDLLAQLGEVDTLEHARPPAAPRRAGRAVWWSA